MYGRITVLSAVEISACKSFQGSGQFCNQLEKGTVFCCHTIIMLKQYLNDIYHANVDTARKPMQLIVRSIYVDTQL